MEEAFVTEQFELLQAEPQEARTILDYCHDCACSTAQETCYLVIAGPWLKGYCDKCGTFAELGSVRSRELQDAANQALNGAK